MCEEVVRRFDYVCNFKVIDQTLLMSPKSIVNCVGRMPTGLLC